MRFSLLIILTLLFSINSLAQTNRPNIIVILADDMGYSDLGCMGSEIETPNLDQLANDGVLFTHFYNTSRCTPSRGSILTGLSGHQAGVGHLNSDWEYASYQGHLADNAVTIAELLQPEGYRTIQVGKWHVGNSRPYWPIDKGFERMYGIPAGGGVYFWPPHNKVGSRPVYLGEEVQSPDPDTWYSTDAFTDYAIDFVEEANTDSKPFFMYLAYIAPHFPLQAWPDDIAKYRNEYSVGYEEIRNARFQKQKQLGVVSESVTMSPADFPDWSSVSDQDLQDHKMAIYAAQIDNMDSNIGRLIQKLKDLGQYDNTLIMFLSDNGGASASHNTSTDFIGTKDSFVSYGKNWANVSNTPYRRYKTEEHEGGILTPLIVHYPNGITNSGLITHEAAHISDIVPTCLELTEISYPTTFNGLETMNLAGESFWSIVQGGSTDDTRVFGWEHEGNKGVRVGDWKLVKLYGSSWELYNLANDPTELNDLSGTETARVETLKEEYEKWKVRSYVIDWNVNTTINYEMEKYDLLNSQVNGTVEVINDVDASNNEVVEIGSTAIGEYAEFKVPIYVPGYYNIGITQKNGSDQGKYKLYLDGEEISSEIDQYTAETNYSSVYLPQLFIDAGMATLRIQCTGKNETSSGYNLAIDKLTMTYSREETILSNSEFERMHILAQQINGSTSIISDGSASEGKYIKVVPSGAGEYMEFSINVESTGTYGVSISHKLYTSRGQIQIYLNGEAIGGVVDQYGSSGFQTVELGETILDEGECVVRLEVTGKNPSSTGYSLSLDKLSLEFLNGTSIDTIKSSDQSLFFPNPALSSITFIGEPPAKVVFVDMGTGVKKMELVNLNQSVDIKNLNNGIYLIIMTYQQKTVVRKLIVK